jgi:hypothetical protein
VRYCVEVYVPLLHVRALGSDVCLCWWWVGLGIGRGGGGGGVPTGVYGWGGGWGGFWGGGGGGRYFSRITLAVYRAHRDFSLHNLELFVYV